MLDNVLASEHQLCSLQLFSTVMQLSYKYHSLNHLLQCSDRHSCCVFQKSWMQIYTQRLTMLTGVVFLRPSRQVSVPQIKQAFRPSQHYSSVRHPLGYYSVTGWLVPVIMGQEGSCIFNRPLKKRPPCSPQKSGTNHQVTLQNSPHKWKNYVKLSHNWSITHSLANHPVI